MFGMLMSKTVGQKKRARGDETTGPDQAKNVVKNATYLDQGGPVGQALQDAR